MSVGRDVVDEDATAVTSPTLDEVNLSDDDGSDDDDSSQDMETESSNDSRSDDDEFRGLVDPPPADDHLDDMQFRIVDVSQPMDEELEQIGSSPVPDVPSSSQSILVPPESIAHLVESMRMNSAGDVTSMSDQLLKRRIKDFQYAQKQRHKRYSFRPFGITGLFVNLSDIRSDLRWAQDAANRRAEGLPYVSWKDYEKNRQKGKNHPFFTYALLLVCTVLMLIAFHWNHWRIEKLKVNPLLGPDPDTLLLLGALQMRDMVETGAWHHLATAVFLHGGIIHLVVNLAVLGVLGRAIERNHGWLGTAAIFMVSAVGGNIISCLMQPGYILVGASGGIFGLIGVCVADVVLNWKLLFLAFKDHNGKPASWWMKLCSIFWLLFDLALNSVIGLTPFVDNFAHLGGFVYGFLISLTFLRRLPLSFFGSSGGFCHSLRIKIFRFTGVMFAVTILVVTCILLSESDGLTSACFSCRYISCAPFPFWTDDKWWYCDGCDAATGTVYRRNGDALLTDLDLYCPATGNLVEIDIEEDGFKDASAFLSSLPKYCRQYC